MFLAIMFMFKTGGCAMFSTPDTRNVFLGVFEGFPELKRRNNTCNTWKNACQVKGTQPEPPNRFPTVDK